MSVSVEHWQDVSSVHEESWERQCRLFRPAVRVLPSDQQRTGGVVPAEPFVLEGPEVGQPRGGTLWLLRPQRQLHQWPGKSRVPFLLHVALRRVLLGTLQIGRRQTPLARSSAAIAMDPRRKSLGRLLLVHSLALPSGPVQWAPTLVGHLGYVLLLEESPTLVACMVADPH